MTSENDLHAILLIMDRRLNQLEQRLADVENILISNSLSIKRSSHRKVEIENNIATTSASTTPKPKMDQKRSMVIKRGDERNHKYTKQTLLKLRRDFFARKENLTDPFNMKTKILTLSPSSSPASSPTNAKHGSIKSMSPEQIEGGSEKSVGSVKGKVAHNLVIEEDDDEEEGGVTV